MEFKWGYNGDESANDAYAVRLKVFVDEQGFSPEIEIDTVDTTAMHLTGYNDNGEPVCAARLFCEHESLWHAGRIAVLQQMRGTGVGKMLMNELANKASEAGATEIMLGAQYDKAAFYEKCGYAKTGKEFLDEGYPHVEMKIIIADTHSAF